MFEQYTDILSKCAIFNNIAKPNINIMLDCIKPKIDNFKKNEFIAMKGDNFKSIGIVIYGNVSIVKENLSGDRMLMTALSPGGIFGEMAVFSKKALLPATVEAHDNCSILFLPGDKIISPCSKACQWHSQLISNMLMIISDKALKLNKHIEYLNIKSIRSKISTFLTDEYKIHKKDTFKLSLNRNELANFFNVSRPSLSREMCSMRDEGLIDFHKSSIHIIDIETLKDMSE